MHYNGRAARATSTADLISASSPLQESLHFSSGHGSIKTKCNNATSAPKIESSKRHHSVKRSDFDLSGSGQKSIAKIWTPLCVLGTLPRVSLLYPRSMTSRLAPSSIYHTTQEQRPICLGDSEGYQKRIC